MTTVSSTTASTPSANSTAMVWIRRDFRLDDHHTLNLAMESCDRVILAFVLDPKILNEFAHDQAPATGVSTLDGLGIKLSPPGKPHAYFLGTLLAMRERVRAQDGEIQILVGDPTQEIPAAAKRWGATHVFWGRDFEPNSRARDEQVKKQLDASGIKSIPTKEHVLIAPGEVLNKVGEPYRVFTPYKVACLDYLKTKRPTVATRINTDKWHNPIQGDRSLTTAQGAIWKSLQSLVKATSVGGADGKTPLDFELGEDAAQERLRRFIEDKLAGYEDTRNLPADVRGTSRISGDIRAGALSARQVFVAVRNSRIQKSVQDVYIAELLWREFFMMIGWYFPHVFGANYNPKYKIKWRNDPDEFQAWCEGRTGFPIVDAGMRELVQTGFMHNRVRMITAMFLVKDLLIDWQWGERFFRQHLIDADIAVNNGNWQWSASTGVDAQPYFRIFNPESQAKKFDPKGEYISRFVPEWRGFGYPPPIVDHAEARVRCLKAYQ